MQTQGNGTGRRGKPWRLLRVLGGPPALSARKAGHEPYLCRMFKAFYFCIPTKSTIVPVGPDWLHEVKYDGYRLRLERDGDTRISGDW
jgi:hypothetical protein